jgi:predicted DsbA family dithiol-disulfide isomerase
MTRLDIFSDPVCPWCHIGKANLDRALEAHPNHDFAIEWHPFQLNPDMPREGMDKRAYLEGKFGADQRTQMYLRLKEASRAAGAEIDPELAKHMPNTLDAHRLTHWAGLEGRQTPVVGAIMRAYWREGRDIGNPAVLADIAAAQGMDRAVVARLLDSDADADDLRARDRDAREKGVNSVPTFLIAGQYVVTGAQPPDLWAKVIADLASQA